MRKLILFMMVTVDGFFEGPHQEIDWHNADEEFNEFAIAQMQSVDTLLFGRVTYEMMASYWPTAEAIANDPVVAQMMNAMPKIVFSKSLDQANWNNTWLIKEELANAITTLKHQPGKDLIIFGSANLATTLASMGLIDEFRIMVNPVALGEGHSLFAGMPSKLNLKLITTRSFHSGNVLLYYQPGQR